MKKNLTLILRASIGLIIIGFLIYKIDITKILNLLSKIDWFIWPLFLVPHLLVLFVGTLNIKLILHGTSEHIGFCKLLKKNLISKSIGMFLPGRIGEASLVYLLKKEGISYGKSILAFIIDKLINLIVITFFSIPAFFIFFERELALKLSFILIIFVGIICFSLISHNVRYLITRFILRKYSKLFTGFSIELFFLFKKKKYILFFNFLITLFMLTTISLVIFLLLIYFGTTTPLLYILIILSLGMLSSQIPISIAGLGIRESVVIYLYSLIGVEPEIIGTIYLVFAFFSYLFAGGVLLYNTKKLR